MRRIAIRDNQNLLDIAIQEYGTVNNLIELARVNSISVTDVLVSGENLQITPSIVSDENIKKYYKSENIIPATAQLSDQMAALVAQYEPVPDDSEGGNTTFSREYTFEYAKEFGTII